MGGRNGVWNGNRSISFSITGSDSHHPTIWDFGLGGRISVTHSASPLWLSSSHSPLNLKIGLLFYVSFLSAGDSSHGMSSSVLIPVLCLSLNASVQGSGRKMFASEGTCIHWEVLQKQHCVICVYLWFGLIKIEVIVHIMLCFFCFNLIFLEDLFHIHRHTSTLLFFTSYIICHKN